MWGEFEDSDEKKDDTSQSSQPDKLEQIQSEGSSQALKDDNTEGLPLRDRIIHHIAASSLTLKSQQRYEPDLTFEERMTLAGELLEKPGKFLYRFGNHLQREHFQYFLDFEGDPEVDHYVAESLKHLNKHTAKITVRNRRYAAMQELKRSGSYFSEKEMERRDPLLYEQLVARHLTEEEKRIYEESAKDDDQRFSSLLLDHIDSCSERQLMQQQEEIEDDMLEEDDSDEDDEGEEEMEDVLESREKQLLKEEFYSHVYHDFLKGKDTEFDYGRVDASDAYDLLDIRARDEEERYFDEDDDVENSRNPSCKDGVDDNSSMCCG